MKEVIYFSFVAASVSFAITETKLFMRFREWMKRKNSLLGELLSCGYCFCHWAAFALVAVYRPRLMVSSWGLLDYFLTALIIAWLGVFQWIVLCWLMARTGR